MQIRMIFEAQVTDSEDLAGLREQVAMCFEELGAARLISVAPVKGSEPMKVGRGTYGNVMLSDAGYAELVARYGAAKAEALIADLSYKLHQKNYKFADHFAVIVEWEEKERNKPTAHRQATSFDVDEFFAAAVKKGVGE